MLIVTSFVYAAGLLLMAVVARFPGACRSAGFLVGIGTAGTGFGVLIGTVSRATPPEKRSQTVGLVAAAGSLGTFVIAPLGQHLIDGLGWQGGNGRVRRASPRRWRCFRCRSASRRRPTRTRRMHQKLGEAVREAIGHRGYLFMTLAFFACGFQLVFITTHLPAYLQLCGVAPGVGASALGADRSVQRDRHLLFGLLGARYSQKHLLAMIYLLRTLIIVVFLLVPVSAASTLVFAAAMGFLWLGVAPLVTGIIGRVFGLTHFNTLYGVVFLSHQVGSFFGAWMGGVVFDRFGNYNFAWGALIVDRPAAFTLQWLMDEQPPRESRLPSRAACRGLSGRRRPLQNFHSPFRTAAAGAPIVRAVHHRTHPHKGRSPCSPLPATRRTPTPHPPPASAARGPAPTPPRRPAIGQHADRRTRHRRRQHRDRDRADGRTAAPHPARLEQRYAEAVQAFQAQRYSAAYGRFAALADEGHAPAALMALALVRYAPMFGAEWSATPAQMEDWSALAMQDMRVAGALIARHDRGE